MNTSTLSTPLDRVILMPAAGEEVTHRARQYFHSSEHRAAFELDLAKRLPRHRHFGDREISAEFQRSLLVVTRGMDFD